MIDKKVKNLLDILSTREPKTYCVGILYIQLTWEYNNYLIYLVLCPKEKILEFSIHLKDDVVFLKGFHLDENEYAEYLTLTNKLGTQFTNKLFANLLTSETTIDELWDNEGDRVDNLVKTQ